MSQTTVLFVPDLHKRDVDFTSIKGYVEAVELVQQDIVEYLKTLTNGMFVSMGDWYDKGYRSTGRVFADSFYDTEIAKAVNGNAYICLGNHFFLERDSNPEMYLIQPSYLYKPRINVPMQEPTFKTADHVIIGRTQISFFHFNKTDKNYYTKVESGVNFHIGVYHDECVLPSDIRQQAGFFGNTSNDYLNNIYANVDLAICGHIHTAIGMRNYTLNSGKVIPIVVPGALAITENKDIVKHKSVMCPVATITEDQCSISFQEFSTHMDCLKFYKMAEQKKATDTLEAMGSADGEYKMPSAVSLSDYLYRKGYSEREVRAIMSIQPGATDSRTILNLISEEMSDGLQS